MCIYICKLERERDVFAYVYMCICVYIYIYIYMYVCIYIISPLNKKPPLLRNPPLGGNFLVTINLEGGTITPVIGNPPSEANIVTINLDGGTINLDGGNEVIL